jgi:hypothetical protein
MSRIMYIKAWRADNPEKNYDSRMRKNKRNAEPEVKARKKAYDQRRRDERNSKRIIIEPLE